LLAVGGEKQKANEKRRNEFHNGSFWLTDKGHTEITAIANRNKINRVKTGQNLTSLDPWQPDISSSLF
jgi:hypothetical protein